MIIVSQDKDIILNFNNTDIKHLDKIVKLSTSSSKFSKNCTNNE